MRVKDVIVSDDIRIEVGNKFSLIGIYFDKIRIQGNGTPINYPAPIKLGLMLRMLIEADDVFPQDFKVNYFIDKHLIAAVDGKLDPGAAKPKNLNIPIVMTLPLSQKGVLDFSIEFSRDGKVIKTFDNLHPMAIVEHNPLVPNVVAPGT